MMHSRLRPGDLLLEPFLAPFLMRNLMRGEDLHREIFGQEDASRHLIDSRSSSAGAVNISSHDNDITVECVAPGVKPDDLDVTVHGRRLEIRGKRPAVSMPEGGQILRRERWSGEFRRIVELPFEADAATVNAVYSKGILTLTLHRQAGGAKKIEIKTKEENHARE